MGVQSLGISVSQVMSHKPISADINAPIQEIAELMFSENIRHVPIIENGALAGIVSDRDLKGFIGVFPNFAFPGNEELEEKLAQPISSLIETNVISVTAEDDLVEVIDLMLEDKIGAVPVVESQSGKLVGIVSYIDILRAVREGMVPG